MKKLYAVGLGPGDGQTITPQAAAAIAESQTVCGYTVYIDLIRPLCQGKEIITTPMTRYGQPAVGAGAGVSPGGN